VVYNLLEQIAEVIPDGPVTKQAAQKRIRREALDIRLREEVARDPGGGHPPRLSHDKILSFGEF
jgi:hypothetical protein